MRNLKKFLALVLAILMVMSVAVMTGVSAADEADHTEAAQHLSSLKIMKGNENGDLMLANGVTRYQAALFFVQTLTGKTDVSVWNAEKKSAIFSDVVEYGTAIDYAYNIQIVRGRGNGVYGYNDPITYQDMLVMAVRALGYETENMSYPYGYILAAQKLELDEDLDELVNFKAELNRGQTAEIIWKMLNTEVAVEDFEGNKVYPGKSYYNKYADKEMHPDREKLLKKSGFSDGTIESKIISTCLNKDEKLPEDEDPYVTLEGGLKIKAADLGITEETLKATYLGLPVKLYVDCDAKDFGDKYEDDDATVVFADFGSYTTVENLGDAGNIKYTVKNDDFDVEKPEKEALALGGEKFDLTDKDLTVNYYKLDKKDGWKAEEKATVLGAFKYSTSDKEYVGANTYGKIQYSAVTDKDDKTTLTILYTPYEFAQYFVRSLKDASTAQKANFVTLAKYNGKLNDTLDDEKSYFEEKFVNTAKAFDNWDAVGADDTKVVASSKGKDAKNVKVTGESIKSGDFFFGYYNQLDNIIEVAMNCGAFQTGRMTAKNDAKETVKIGGTTYNFGFKGVYDKLPAYDAAGIPTIIAEIKADKDNAKYILADGNVVFAVKADGTSSSDDDYFPYAIVAFQGEYLADLLDMDKADLAKNSVGKTDCKFYVKDGKVQIAVMNTATATWELATLDTFVTEYNSKDNKIGTEVDVATLAQYADMTAELSATNETKYAAVKAAIDGKMVFAVIEESNGAYKLAAVSDTADKIVKIDNRTIAQGLVFSEGTAKTNAISADHDETVDAKRVTLDANTIIILINEADGKVAVRKGVQKTGKNVTSAITYYSANSDLILGTTTHSLSDWGEGKNADADETYYVVTADTNVEVSVDTDSNDKPVYTYTADGLFDLRTGKIVNGITEEIKGEEKSKLNAAKVGDILYTSGDYKYTPSGKVGAVDDENKVDYKKIAELDGETYAVLDLTKINFKDENTFYVDKGNDLQLGNRNFNDENVAVADIKVNVTTVVLTAADDLEDYDMDQLFINVEKTDEASMKAYEDITTVENPENEKEYYAYALNTDAVVEITGPEAGVFDQYILDVNGKVEAVAKTIYALDDDAEKTAGTVTITMNAVARYEDNVLYINVYRFVSVNAIAN